MFNDPMYVKHIIVIAILLIIIRIILFPIRTSHNVYEAACADNYRALINLLRQAKTLEDLDLVDGAIKKFYDDYVYLVPNDLIKQLCGHLQALLHNKKIQLTFINNN